MHTVCENAKSYNKCVFIISNKIERVYSRGVCLFYSSAYLICLNVHLLHIQAYCSHYIVTNYFSVYFDEHLPNKKCFKLKLQILMVSTGSSQTNTSVLIVFITKLHDRYNCV